MLEIVLKHKWDAKGWEYSLSNRKDGQAGYFVRLGIRPEPNAAINYIETSGIDIIEACVLADELGVKFEASGVH